MNNRFDVTVRLAHVGDPFGKNSENLDALYEAGCDDATFSSTRAGFLMASFDRAGAKEQAVASAMSDIARALPDAEITKIEFVLD